jgi:hypothetical protein
MAGRREMRRLLVMMAGTVITMVLAAAPAVANESTDSMRATAVAACKERAGAKNVTVTVKVDGEATNYRYACSKILGTAPARSNVPAVTDFKVGIDVLKKQCFGSAGCSIAYKIDVTHRRSTSLDPSKVYTVVYDVVGAESPITENFTIHGTTVNSHKGTAYTPNKGALLTAKVTSVFEGS